MRGRQSGRLLSLLSRHGFNAERIGPSQLWIEGGTAADVQLLALLFAVPGLEVCEAPRD